MKQVMIFAGDDTADLETAFAKAGVKCERMMLRALAVGGGDHTVLLACLAIIQATAIVIVGFAKHKKKRLVLKVGDREMQAENFTPDQLAEVLPKVREIAFRDPDTKHNAEPGRCSEPPPRSSAQSHG